jgi:hypothetical protein
LKPKAVASRNKSHVRLGIAWLLFCAALSVHVADEALTGFLGVYNPTVLALRTTLGFWPMPAFEFRPWLTGLIILIIVLAGLSPFAFRNARWMRRIMLFCVIVAGVLNALGHTVATIFGRTVPTVQFPRPAPGFYSSPLLFTMAIYVLVQLTRTARQFQPRREIE